MKTKEAEEAALLVCQTHSGELIHKQRHEVAYHARPPVQLLCLWCWSATTSDGVQASNGQLVHRQHSESMSARSVFIHPWRQECSSDMHACQRVFVPRKLVRGGWHQFAAEPWQQSSHLQGVADWHASQAQPALHKWTLQMDRKDREG